MERCIREIRVKDLLLYFLLPLLILAVLGTAIGLSAVFLDGALRIILIIASVVFIYFDLKYLLIGSVLMYKAFAPKSVRDKCRFHPCCSTYMIMAVKKYGLIRGFIKGLARIMRCKPPNGGTDLP